MKDLAKKHFKVKSPSFIKQFNTFTSKLSVLHTKMTQHRYLSSLSDLTKYPDLVAKVV